MAKYTGQQKLALNLNALSQVNNSKERSERMIGLNQHQYGLDGQLQATGEYADQFSNQGFSENSG